ncbi:YccF domain-containing protein [Leptolyngbya sp. CCNP1308]|uniref:YccF domain-containing protein n=1 Tax=Leptolyngbya sp. CCNP1308 TaxID=3110255 RepID=UPI002B219FD3|nr:YccF domain-containing protein [Leptolyngbya sp. CCNP1308]MEA5452234.1 YccF domain-containing protein [Leptolyngbya sp. CCNP1308]
MSLLGNIIWLIFGGFLTGLGYILGGLVLCLTIVGIPFGVQAIKLGTATMTPFGRKLVEDSNPNSALKIVLNVAWLFFFGWEIALVHLFHAVLLAITLIGLPFAKQHIKLVPLALFPFGRSFERL